MWHHDRVWCGDLMMSRHCLQKSWLIWQHWDLRYADDPFYHLYSRRWGLPQLHGQWGICPGLASSILVSRSVQAALCKRLSELVLTYLMWLRSRLKSTVVTNGTDVMSKFLSPVRPSGVDRLSQSWEQLELRQVSEEMGSRRYGASTI